MNNLLDGVMVLHQNFILSGITALLEDKAVKKLDHQSFLGADFRVLQNVKGLGILLNPFCMGKYQWLV